MSGNIGEKARAAFLALIMVTSVMVAGVALTGFAAADTSDNVANASISANPAGLDITDDSVGHVAIVELDGASSTFEGGPEGADTFNVTFSGTNNIEYGDVNAGDISLQAVQSDGTVTDQSTNVVVVTSNNDGKIEIGTTDGDDIDLSNHEYLRVAISTGIDHNGLDTSNDLSARLALDLTAGDSNDGVEYGDTEELAVGSNAPITMDASENDGTNYTSLEEAVEDIDSTKTERITVRGDVSEFESQPVAVGSFAAAGAAASESDYIIEGQNDPTIDLATTGIDLNDGDNVTIRDISFAASDVAGDFDFAAIVTSNGASDAVTIENNTFSDFAGSDVIDVGTGGVVNNLSITDNTLEVGATNGITVAAQLNDDNGEFLNVSGNTITYTDANTGLGLTVDEDSNTPTDVTIDGNEVVGDGSDGTGISLAGSTATLSLADNSVDNIATGVSLGSGSQSKLTLSDLTLANISSGTPVGVDATGTLASGPAVTIDGLAVDTSSGATAVAVQDDIDLKVVDSTIADVSEAVDVTSANAVTITNTTITGASGDQAVHIDQPGGDASITIDGKTSIDQTDGDAIEVALGDAVDGQSVTIDDVTLNGSTGAGVQVVDLDDVSGTQPTVDITNSTFSHNDIGLDVDSVTDEASTLRAHFNTFDANTNGVDVADLDVGSFEVNVTFNDYRNSGEDGVVVASQSNSDTVNAKYSYWGSDAGPNSDLGDSVTAAAGDATTEPFLLESAVDNYDDSNLGGTNVLRFGHNVEVTNNKGAVSFPTTANRTAGASIEGETTDVMVYKLVDGQLIDAGDQVPDTMEGHVIDLTESSRTSAWVTISYSDDVQDGLGGVTYEQGQNLVGPPTQGEADAATVFGLSGEYVISPSLSNTDDKFASENDLAKAVDNPTSKTVSPFKAYIIEVPDADDELVDRFRGGNIPGGTDASEVETLLNN